jgi:chromosome segregation ATPase
MATKDELQNTLKDKYKINKNISQVLTKEECEQLLELLKLEPSTAKLVQSFVQKNSNLSNNNALYGRMRSKAEAKLSSLQEEYEALEASIQAIESDTTKLEERKQQLEAERQQLEAEVQRLASYNTRLETKVETLASQNTELTGANEQLKKDNKNLKNIVDQIKLQLARDTKALLQYEDNQIRRAVIKLFRWTLG